MYDVKSFYTFKAWYFQVMIFTSKSKECIFWQIGLTFECAKTLGGKKAKKKISFFFHCTGQYCRTEKKIWCYLSLPSLESIEVHLFFSAPISQSRQKQSIGGSLPPPFSVTNATFYNKLISASEGMHGGLKWVFGIFWYWILEMVYRPEFVFGPVSGYRASETYR